MKTYKLYHFHAERHGQRLYKLTTDDLKGYALDHDEQPECVAEFDTLEEGLKALEGCRNSATHATGYGPNKWVDVEEYALVLEEDDHMDMWPCEIWEGGNA